MLLSFPLTLPVFAGIDTKGCKKACLLNSEDGEEMTAFGGDTATLQIGSHTTSWPVYVAPYQRLSSDWNGSFGYP